MCICPARCRNIKSDDSFDVQACDVCRKGHPFDPNYLPSVVGVVGLYRPRILRSLRVHTLSDAQAGGFSDTKELRIFEDAASHLLENYAIKDEGRVVAWKDFYFVGTCPDEGKMVNGSLLLSVHTN